MKVSASRAPDCGYMGITSVGENDVFPGGSRWSSLKGGRRLLRAAWVWFRPANLVVDAPSAKMSNLVPGQGHEGEGLFCVHG